MYYFINWIHSPDGYCPALPADTAFLLLAEPREVSAGATFALFECELPEGFPVSEEVEVVSEHLGALLDSAKAYPPALALTRDDVRKRNCRSKQAFAEALAHLLHAHLAAQRTAPCFLAVARKTEPGYKQAGGYYWIVNYRGETVAWVSRDYWVYRDAVEDFDIDRAELEKRFGSPTRRA